MSDDLIGWVPVGRERSSRESDALWSLPVDAILDVTERYIAELRGAGYRHNESTRTEVTLPMIGLDIAAHRAREENPALLERIRKAQEALSSF